MAGKYKSCLLFFFIVAVLFFPSFSVHAEYDGYPVIIVPGMLASFDKELIYHDKEDNKWGFVWGGNVYKALINELKNNGYEEGKSLFIAYYDWRKPVSETYKKYLVPKIEEAKGISGKDKVDIVAHSMGGLLSRAYIESDDYKNDVNRFVMMGTPNNGASEAYVAWEGGLFPSTWNAKMRFYIDRVQKQLRKTRKLPDIIPPLSFREFFPGLKDLLPTVQFVNKGSDKIALTNMADKNDFLIGLNDKVSRIKERVRDVRTYAGLTGKTFDEITLGDICTIEDNNNKRWRDGHPNPDPPTANSDQGDETVLLTSATISGIENYTYDGTSHVKIPDEARVTIPWFLNPPVLMYVPQPFRALVQNLIVTPTARADDADLYVEPDSMLGFTVSPNVNFIVTDPDGKILSRDKNELGEDNANFDDDQNDPDDIILVTIRNPKTGKYTLSLTGNIAGSYSVDSVYATSDNTFEDSNEGTIGQDETKTLEAAVSDTEGVTLPPSDSGTPTDTPTPNKVENNNGTSSNSSRGGNVLGASIVRLKLTDTILAVQNKLTTLLHNKKPTDPKITKAVYQKLMGPLNELLTRARMYEIAVKAKKTKLAASLLDKMKGDYGDFANKVDQLIAEGKLNKQTVNILTALKQKLKKAGL